LYGTTDQGAAYNCGTLFKVATDGSAFTVLQTFSFPGGGGSGGGLLLANSILYGTALYGGANGNGIVFAVNIDGTAFSTLHTFTATSGVNFSNSDGSYPNGDLILSGDKLYGTAAMGGTSGYGTVFALNIDGTGFITLHNFAALDGANPYSGLALSGNTFYGTTVFGGAANEGTIFSLQGLPNASNLGLNRRHVQTPSGSYSRILYR
jgi:uncharacterized repeat protein (TIGR03803 family)